MNYIVVVEVTTKHDFRFFLYEEFFSTLRAKLGKQLSSLSVSIRYDGGVKYDDVLTCGISSTDSTQQIIFAMESDIKRNVHASNAN